jgi:hypothetical protein
MDALADSLVQKETAPLPSMEDAMMRGIEGYFAKNPPLSRVRVSS